MNWVWLMGGTWLAAGIVIAFLIGRSIHLADLEAEDASRDGSSAHTPRIGGCVSPSERLPSEHEHGAI
jgi:hypothetical protein